MKCAQKWLRCWELWIYRQSPHTSDTTHVKLMISTIYAVYHRKWLWLAVKQSIRIYYYYCASFQYRYTGHPPLTQVLVNWILSHRLSARFFLCWEYGPSVTLKTRSLKAGWNHSSWDCWSGPLGSPSGTTVATLSTLPGICLHASSLH